MRPAHGGGDVVTPSGDALFCMFCMLMFSIVSENVVSAFGGMAGNFIVIFPRLSRGQFTRVRGRHVRETTCKWNVVKTSYSPVRARARVLLLMSRRQTCESCQKKKKPSAP